MIVKYFLHVILLSYTVLEGCAYPTFWKNKPTDDVLKMRNASLMETNNVMKTDDIEVLDNVRKKIQDKRSFSITDVTTSTSKPIKFTEHVPTSTSGNSTSITESRQSSSESMSQPDLEITEPVTQTQVVTSKYTISSTRSTSQFVQTSETTLQTSEKLTKPTIISTAKMTTVTQSISITVPSTSTPDWQTWCEIQCKKGIGGTACNCDIIP